MIVTTDGSMVLFMCQKNEERKWLEENTTAESWQWMGDTLVVEPRYAGPLVRAVREEGFL